MILTDNNEIWDENSDLFAVEYGSFELEEENTLSMPKSNTILKFPKERIVIDKVDDDNNWTLWQSFSSDLSHLWIRIVKGEVIGVTICFASGVRQFANPCVFSTSYAWIRHRLIDKELNRKKRILQITIKEVDELRGDIINLVNEKCGLWE